MKSSHSLSLTARTEQDPESCWQTPPDIVKRVHMTFGAEPWGECSQWPHDPCTIHCDGKWCQGNPGIDLDPCTTPENPVGAKKFYTPADDGILMPWEGRVYVNPPYGRTIAHWTDKAIGHDGPTILLVPSRTDAAWFQRLAAASTGVVFLAGRLRFVGASSSAPFPNALVGLRVDLEQLADLGWFVPNRKVA